jgi:transposase
VKHFDIAELGRMYGRGMTCRQIAAHVGTSPNSVLRRLKRSGVSLRNPGFPFIAQLADREWLRREYVEAGKSTTEISHSLQCSSRSVALWLKRHRIPARTTGSEAGHSRNTEAARRKMSEAKRGKFLGETNPNWRGGIQTRDPDRGRYPYKMWMRAVRDRDGWQCVQCGSKERLHAHHIKQWKSHPELRFAVSNGMTLCHSCHERVHGRKLAFPLPWHVERPKSASAAHKAA